MANPEVPNFIGDTPVENHDFTDNGELFIELADLRPNGIVEPNSEEAMKIAKDYREGRLDDHEKRFEAWRKRAINGGANNII